MKYYQPSVTLGLFTLLLFIPVLAYAQQLSGVNQLTFHNAKSNHAFIGNAFLLQYRDKVYALTVKHVLLEANVPDMQSVSIKDHIAQWQISANNADHAPIILGKLLNEDPSEKLDMAVLEKDWLVFEMPQQPTFLTPLLLRRTPIAAGEMLTAVGCTYLNQASCLQNTYTGEFLNKENNNLRVKMANMEPTKLRGLSGSPVVDEYMQLVGIVSNVMKSKSADGFDFAPASTDYLVEVLDRLTAKTKE
ncbi:trypsin-like peptidase domain-containing protein [Bowmanella denitrificans]|uniref:trypsin-like peptidase domain-containing protein n=1 Tax=Bowmanella denitrificans TaxID=366582 RepID=UPI000C9AEB71|nr:trypsin-like peptidase domain-containing protein [Bowmanella denitrificans]